MPTYLVRIVASTLLFALPRFMDRLFEFQKLWESSETAPDLAEFVASSADLDIAEAAEIIRFDLQRRSESGELRDIEEYFAAFPRLHAEREIAAQLIELDVKLRVNTGQKPDLELLFQRFPWLRDQLGGEVTGQASEATELVINDIQIDQLCDRFEEEFERGQKPSIDAYLAQVPKDHREQLLRQLLPIEFSWLQRQASTFRREDYLDRFTDFSTQVDEDWEEFVENSPRQLTSDSGFDTSFSNVQPAATQSPADADPHSFGDYKVLSKLGAGTFGSVYKAQHSTSGNIVAIKMLKAEWANNPKCGHAMRVQFAAEAHTMFKFDHPNIVKVLSIDEHADPPYFVQEFIDGKTLAERLQETRQTLEQALTFAIQIAEGLTRIHLNGHWHRDLKPANILLDSQDQVYIADFGLALDDAQRWRSARGQIGTFPYMAPEQIKGATHRLNARCDIWALGVILYEMLTGRRPFQGTTREQLIDEILGRTPSAPRELNPEVPRELNRLCMQCLAKRDADRPNTAADLRDDLAGILKRLEQGLTPPAASFHAPFATTANAVGILPAPNDYPVPTLKRFTAEQAELYLRLMPCSYSNEEELPELIAYWKQRILEPVTDRSFAVGIMVGISGCGKSSMLEAGLVPVLPDSVIPILIEASYKDTESRLLTKLRYQFPDVDQEQDWTLADWAFRLRNGSLLPPGKKVVLILDQFEQWLIAHGSEKQNDLLDALHQCDRVHLQALICVREGFHATLMRFAESLDLVLDADLNYATAHRFKLDHARFILSQFGRGLHRLDEPLTEAQQTFLDTTIQGLAETDGGIVCVRLVVLALVMQDRPWTVEELQKLGGLEGIGAQFLADCFEGRTASEQYRRYLPAAMRVLSELLPGEGLEVKRIRSYQDLFSASELDERQFDDLLGILSGKLFLLTLIETDRSTASGDVPDSRPGSRNYQLTHDFLVPSIREWLGQKLRETREGRAYLRLKELSAAWTAKPEKRNLPTLWEWLTILRMTPKNKWNKNERVVMRQARRVHIGRGGVFLATTLIVALTGTFAWKSVIATQERMRVKGLIEQLITAEPDQLPKIVNDLRHTPELVAEFTEPILDLSPRTVDQRRSNLHAKLAMMCQDESLVMEVCDDLLSNKVAYIRPVCEIISQQNTVVPQHLQAILRNSNLVDKRRFRAGVVLAALAHSEVVWSDEDLSLLANELVTANAEEQPIFREILRPLAGQLQAPIETIFKDADATDAMRLGAANAMVDLFASNTRLLTLLLADATPEQFEVVFPLVEAAASAEGLAELELIAATAPPNDLGSIARIPYGQRRANAAVSLLRLGEREKVLPVFDCIDDPESLTQFIFRCRPRGIGPKPLLEVLDILASNATDRDSTGMTDKASQDNARARYAVLLTLGDFAWSEIPSEQQKSLVKLLSSWYANDPSSCVHGACSWVLRQWGLNDIVAKTDKEPVPYSENREWFNLAIEVQPELNDWGFLAPLITKPPKKTFHFTFVVCTSGDFQIGSVEDEAGRVDGAWELRHPVRLTRRFGLLNRELTFEELTAFSKRFDDFRREVNAPQRGAACGVHWYDGVAFCRWLSNQQPGFTESEQAYASPGSLDAESFARESNPTAGEAPINWPIDLDRRGFRLPTEAEWEVAARAGFRTAYSFGGDSEHLDNYGWYAKNSNGQIHPPAQLRPGLNGLFDVHGNMLELTHDWSSEFYSVWAADPTGPLSGFNRVTRGGSTLGTAANCRTSAREFVSPTFRTRAIGLRLAVTLP